METYISENPIATLIFICCIASSLYAFSNASFYEKMMLHPYDVSRKRQLFTLLTSGFIHADWTHLIFNMMTFAFFAFPLERIFVQESPSYGHLLFALLYLIALITSDISTIIKYKNNPNYYSLGASGAISAVLFSFILFLPSASFYLFFIPIAIPAVLFGPLYLAYSAWASRSANDNINHDAHFYGALTGVIYTIILYPSSMSTFINTLQGMFK